MTTHRLKIQEQYADAIMDGTKTFEVRKNDRGYEVGDEIVFGVVTDEGYAVGAAARHPLNGTTYRIDYILDGFEGLAQKYVATSVAIYKPCRFRRTQRKSGPLKHGTGE